jgi:hypothetical protein
MLMIPGAVAAAGLGSLGPAPSADAEIIPR